MPSNILAKELYGQAMYQQRQISKSSPKKPLLPREKYCLRAVGSDDL